MTTPTDYQWINAKGQAEKLSERHPNTQTLMRFLEPNPNLTGTMRGIAHQCHNLAIMMLQRLEDGPELSAGLRKLLEAKDCFVRAAL